MGTVQETVSGKLCQAWTSNTPHMPIAWPDDQFPDGSRAAANNYCRNPDDDPGGLWCYTMDPSTSWEYCDVPLCLKSAAECTYQRIIRHPTTNKCVVQNGICRPSGITTLTQNFVKSFNFSPNIFFPADENVTLTDNLQDYYVN